MYLSKINNGLAFRSSELLASDTTDAVTTEVVVMVRTKAAAAPSRQDPPSHQNSNLRLLTK